MALTNYFPDVTPLQRRFSSLPLFLLLLLLHFLCAPTFTDSTSVEGETYLAEWPDEGPSLRLYPKSPTTGEAIKEEYFGWDVLGFQEKVLCNCCRDATLGMKVLSCDDDLPEGMSPLVDLRQNATWTLEELIPGKKISWTTNNFAGEAIMQFVFEDLNEDLSVNMTNGNMTRALNFAKGGLKFTVRFDNYSPLLFNITEEPDRYFGMTVRNRFYLSRPVVSTIELGVFGLGGVPTQYQIPVVIQTQEEPFLKASFAQTTFSVQDPPSASKELLPQEEWGFETLDAVQRDMYIVDGEIYGQEFELVFAGARSVYYDPDLSVVLEPTDAEDGEKEDGGEDLRLPIALSISLAVVLVAMAVVIGIVWRARSNKKERRNSIATQETVNF